MINNSFIRRVGACAVLLAALGLASCKSDSSSNSGDTIAQTVTVIAEDTPQSDLLGEIYAQALENAGFRVARRNDVPDLAAGYAALQSGAADVFVTHTAELLAYTSANEPAAASTSTTGAPTTTAAASTSAPETTVLETTTTAASVGPAAPTTTGDGPTDTAPDTTAADVTTTTLSIVGQAAAESINGQTRLIGEILPDALQIGVASNAENKAVIACTNAVATTGYLSTLSDLARTSKDLRIAGPPEFEKDGDFGLPGFERVYGATFGEFIPVEPGKVGEQITPPTTVPETTTPETTTPETTVPETGASTGDTAADATTTTTVPLETDADCGAFNSLDPTMPADAVVMDDNLGWIETNGVVPLVATTAFTPGVSQLLDQVSQTLKTADLRVMLGKIADEGLSPAAMASQYISAVGLSGS